MTTFLLTGFMDRCIPRPILFASLPVSHRNAQIIPSHIISNVKNKSNQIQNIDALMVGFQSRSAHCDEADRIRSSGAYTNRTPYFLPSLKISSPRIGFPIAIPSAIVGKGITSTFYNLNRGHIWFLASEPNLHIYRPSHLFSYNRFIMDK